MLEHPGILRFPEFVHVLLASIVESPSAIIANPKQNVFVFPLCCAWAASLAFGGWLGCLVGCLACLWRLARLPLAQIRSTEKMAEGIKPDNVICLVTPGSARQDFLNQSFLKWRATSNNLLCKQSFSWDVFLRTNFNNSNMHVRLSSGGVDTIQL